MSENHIPALPAAILKWLAAAGILVFVILLSAGNAESAAAFDDVAAAVSAAVDDTNMQAADNQMIRRLYGLDPAQYDGVYCLYPTTNMGAEELFLIKLASLDQQQAVVDAVTARRDGQRTAFDGYGIEQCAMLDKSVIEVRGNYILFICAEDTAPVLDAFLGAI